MKKYAKKSLGFLLAMTMAFNPTSNVFALDSADTESVSEPNDEIFETETVEEVTEETLPAEEVVVEETVVTEETVAEETSAEPVEEVQAAEEEISAAEVQDITEEEQEETVPEVQEYEEPESSGFSYFMEGENEDVTLSADEGVLPADTNVTVTPLTLEEVKEMLKDYAAAEGKEIVDAVVYDVVFSDAEGNEIQPEGEVNVKFTNLDLEYEDLTCEALRIRSEEVDSLKTDLDLSEGEAEFTSDHFTPVGVVTFAEANLTEALAANAPVTYAMQQGNWVGYSGYVDGLTFINPLYIMDGGQSLIAYCFNGHLDFPGFVGDEKTRYVAKYENATEEEFSMLNKKNVPNKKDNVLKSVYYGYPYNAGGIQQKYGLDDMQFRAVTQAAVWLFTDNEPLGDGGPGMNSFIFDLAANNYSIPYSGAMFNLTHHVTYTDNTFSKLRIEKKYTWTDAMTQAYNELINNNTFTYPESFELDLYAADTKGYDTPDYQNLLSTKLTTRTTVTQRADIKVEKKWEDNNNASGTRPTEVTVDLFADGSLKETKVLSAATDWKAEFTNLVGAIDGKKIEYTVRERAVDGYTTEVTGSADNGFTITNTSEQAKTININVSKTWRDNEDQDGIRPENVTVVLYRNGVATDITETLNEGNGWSATFENLPEEENGVTYTYSVQEVSVDGYSSSVAGSVENGYEITNTHIPAKTSIKVTKVWEDGGNTDGIRPNEIVVKLLADGQDTGLTKTLNEGNRWYAVFSGMPAYMNKQKVNYTVEEEKVPEGYEVAVSGDMVNGFTLTNTHEVREIEVNVTKNWEDNNDADGIRPDSVTVKLFADGVDTTKTVELNDGNGWFATFDKLEVNNNGKEIEYTVKEVEVDGYKVSVTGDVKAGFEITNTHETYKTSVNVTKNWEDNNDQDGIRPKSVTVKLFADGVDTNKTVELNEDNGWKASFENLEKNKDGQLIVYTIEEVTVEGYEVSEEGNAKDGFTLTNTHVTEKTSVNVTKNWEDNDDQDGIRPEFVTVKLFADGVDTTKTVELNEDNNWFASFEDLDVNNNGKEIKYTVVEVEVEGYTVSVEGDVKEGFTLTNTHTTDTVTIKGTKTWIDRENKERKRPESITVKLLANGVELDTKKVSEADGWEYSWDNLPKKNNGNEIVYSIEEVTVDGYETKVENYNLINTEITRAVEFSKTNIGGEEIAGAEIQILDEDGKVVENWTSDTTSKTIQLKPGMYTFVETAAPKGYVAVNEITFEVKEDGTVEITDVNGNDVTAEDNKLTVVDEYETFDVEVSKKDLGGNEIAGAEIQILDEEGNVVENWTSEEGVTKKIQLREGKYTFHEFAAPEGYEVVTDILFSVNDKGEITIEEDADRAAALEGNTLVVTDTYTERTVKFSKTDLGGNELAGATITVSGTDASGKTYEETWTSTEEAHEISLPMGSYTMEETAAPEGYTIATKIDFTVNSDGTITVNGVTSGSEDQNVVTMIDGFELTKVTFSKTDLGGNELAGATITVRGTDASGKTHTETWKTTETAKELSLPMGSYKMTETAAPEGYEIATKIDFTVNEDGTITVDGVKSESKDNNIVTMVDDYTMRTVRFSKQDLGGKELNGASITVFGSDNSGNEYRKEWVSDGTAKEMNLPMGSYTMEETAAPEGYAIATKIDFTVNADGTITVNGVTSGSEDQNVVTMIDGFDMPKVTFSKTDLGGNELAGATITVSGTDASGMQYTETWETTETAKELSLPMGSYKMTETAAPEGYEIATEIRFLVNADGTITVEGVKSESKDNNVVTMVDDYTMRTVKFSKTDLGGNELAGATITVSGKDASGNPYEETWTSTEEAYEISLPMGSYTMEETVAPEGYEIATKIDFTVNADGTITVNGVTTDSKDNNVVTMVDGYAKRTVKFSKTDLGGNELAGATITVSGKDASGNPYEETWTSTEEAHEFELPMGSYTMEETAAPEGYEIATKIDFTVNADGTITVNGETSESKDQNVVSMIDDFKLRKVTFSKTDIAGEELEGAEITVTGTDTAGIEHTESWTTGETSHEMELPAGSYTMIETAAPEGYEIATKIDFTVNADGTITVDNVTSASEDDNLVTMVDGYSNQNVTISKTDINGTKEIGGAELTVKDEEGNVVETWTSVEDESHNVRLQPGTYILTEERAPEGYKVAESITFTVDHLGNVTVGNENVEKVTMKDDYDNGKVVISKTDVAGKEIAGAELTITDEEGNVVEEWTSEEGKNHEVSLYPGTYTLTETTAPEGYEVAESITFTVDHLNRVTVAGEEVGKVTMVDAYSTHTVKFSKQDILGEELAGASIELKDKNGNVIEAWVSDGTTKELEVLPGTYTFTETAAPEGYLIATDITIVVGIDGSVTSVDVTVTGDDENLVIMVDDLGPLEGVEPEQDIPDSPEESETPEPNPTPTPSPKTPRTPNTPKTGVAADTGAWGILAMSMGMFAGLFLIRRRYSK